MCVPPSCSFNKILTPKNTEAYDLEGNSSEEEVDMEGHVSDTDGEGDPLDSLLKENQIEDTSDVRFIFCPKFYFFCL